MFEKFATDWEWLSLSLKLYETVTIPREVLPTEVDQNWSTTRQQDRFIVLSPLRQPLTTLGGQLQAAILDVKMISFSEIG